MAAIFSTRMDEAIIERLDRAAKRHGLTKKKIVEEALSTYLEALGESDDGNPLDASFGCWEMEETPEETVRKARDRIDDELWRRRS